MNSALSPQEHQKNRFEKPEDKTLVKETRSFGRTFFDNDEFTLTIAHSDGRKMKSKNETYFSIETIEEIKKYFKNLDSFKALINIARTKDGFVYDSKLSSSFADKLGVIINNPNDLQELKVFWGETVFPLIDEIIGDTEKWSTLFETKMDQNIVDKEKITNELDSIKFLILTQEKLSLIPVRPPKVISDSYGYHIDINNTAIYAYSALIPVPKIKIEKEEEFKQLELFDINFIIEWEEYKNKLEELVSKLNNLNLQLEKYHKILRGFNILIIGGNSYLSLESVEIACKIIGYNPLSNKQGTNSQISMMPALISLWEEKPEKDSEKFENWAKSFWLIFIMFLEKYMNSQELDSAVETMKTFSKVENVDSEYKYPFFDKSMIAGYISDIKEEISLKPISEIY
jgi:hypothetical protein